MNTQVQAAMLDETGNLSRATGAPSRLTTHHGIQPRSAARVVGVFFLAAFLTYGIGSSIATGIVTAGETEGSRTLLITGAALMLVNSLIVISIGALMFPILRLHSRAVARVYLGTRVFEGIGLAVGVVSLLVLSGSAAVGANFIAYNVAMAGLGLGSILFCAMLFRTRLVPRFLAAWGAVGYAVFAAGSILELGGVTGAGLLSVIPGGLFELTFGIWLIARGFRISQPAAARDL